MNTIIPFGGRLLVKPLNDDLAVDAAFDQPDQLKQKCQKGRIVEVGPDVKLLRVGDVVLFSLYAPKETEVGGETYVILRETDDEIFAVIK